MFLEKLPDIGFRIFQVSHHNGAFRGFHAMRLFPFGQTFGAEIAFFHHPFGPGGEIRVCLIDKRPGIPEVEAS
jgi:hypothetical protein